MGEIKVAAEQLRDAVRDVLTRLGSDEPATGPTRDEQLDCDRRHPGRSVRWEYNVRTAAGPDAAVRLIRDVLPAYRAGGWQVTDRSSDHELAVQLGRDGTNLGVHLVRDGSTLVVGGSSPCVAG